MDCSISQEEFLAYITGKLQERVKASAPFTLDEFIKDVHKDFTEGFETPAEAIAHTRLIPDMVRDVMLGDEEIADYLGEADLSLKQLTTLRKSFQKGIDNVSVYLGISDIPDIVEVKETKELEVNRARSSNVPTKSNNYPVAPGVWKAKPGSFTNSTWQTALIRTPEQIAKEEGVSLSEAAMLFSDEASRNVEDPKMKPYVEFQKTVVELMQNGSLNSDSRNIRTDELTQGIQLTLMSASQISSKQRLPYVDKYLTLGSEKEQASNLAKEQKRVIMVITNTNGDILYFDNEDKITTEENGTIRYMLLRSVPKIIDGKYDFETSGIQTPETIAQKSKGKITVAAARRALTQEADDIAQIYQYVNSDPKNNKLVGYITGGTLGYVEFDSQAHTPMSEVQLDQKFIVHVDDVAVSDTPGRVSFVLNGAVGDITLNQEVISDEDIEFIASVLTEDITTTNKLGEKVPMSHADKEAAVSTLILLGEGTRLQVFGNEKKLKVDIKGETIIGNYKKEDDLDPADAKRLIIETLRTPFPNVNTTVTAKTLENYRKAERKVWKATDSDLVDAAPGDIVEVESSEGIKYHRLKRVTYNVNNKNIGKQVNFFEITRDETGSALVTQSKLQDYNKWVKAHTWINVKPNAENKIVPHNGYWEYYVLPEEMDKAYNKKSIVPEIKEIAKKSNKKTVSGPSKKMPTLAEMRAESKKKGMGKLYQQKILNQPLTQEKLDEAKKWYNEVSGLAKFLPFEEAFNIINTGDNRVVAQMTAAGATLFDGSDFSDLYHEAWHGFTQFFLTKEQKESLYNEARKLSGSFTTYKNTRVKFSNATELELEEFLAEEFREYMLSDGKKTIAGRPARNSIFKKLWELLKALFSKTSVKEVYADQKAISRTNKLFEKLRFGNLNDLTFDQKNANFSVLYKGLLPLDAKTQKRLPEGLGESDSNRIVKMMDSWIASSNVLAGLRTGLSDEQLTRINELKEKAALTSEENDELKGLNETVRSNREHFSEYKALRLGTVRIALYHELLEKLAEKRAEYDDPEAAEAIMLDYAIDNFGDPFTANSPTTDKGTMFYHLTWTRFLTFKDKYSENFVEDAFNPDRVMGGKRSGYEGTMKQHAAEHEPILSLVSGLHITNPDNPADTLGVNPLMEDIDVLRKLSRLFEGPERNKPNGYKADDRSREALFAKMEAAKHMPEYPFIKELLEKMGSPYDTDNSSIQKLWTGFVTVLNMPIIPLIQTTIDERDGFIQSTVGEAQSDRESTKRLWKSSFKNRQYDENSPLTRYTLRDENNEAYLDLDRLVSDFGMFVPKTGRVVFDRSKNFDFLKAIGIDMDDTEAIRIELEGITSDNYRVYTIYNRLKRIRDAHIGSKEGFPKLRTLDEIVILDLDEIKVLSPGFVKNQDYLQIKGHDQDLNRLIDLQIKYDGKANRTVSTPDGNTAQKASLPSTLSKIVDDINIADSQPALLDMPHMSYLGADKNFMTQRSIIMARMFNQTTLEKIPGARLRLDNIAGLTRTRNGEDHIMGVNTAQEDRLSRAYMNISQTVTKGWSNYIVPADKSTNLTIGVDVANAPNDYINPYLFAVDVKDATNPEKVTSQGRIELQAIMINYLNGELDRINYLKGLKKNSDAYLDNKNTIDNKGKSIYEKGLKFQIFDGVLSDQTKKDLYKVTLEPGQSLLNHLATDTILREAIKTDIDNYINYLMEEFSKNIFEIGDKFFDTNMEKAITRKGRPFHKGKPASTLKLKLATIEATVTTAWIHSLENMIIVYGDPMQWSTEDYIKRNSMFNSPGPGFDVSVTAKEWINKLILAGEIYQYAESDLYTGKKPEARQFDGTLNTAIIADPRKTSVYRDMYKKAFVDKIKASKGYRSGLVSDEQVEIRANVKADKFIDMILGDSSAFLSFDTYRLLRMLNDTWTPVMDQQYRKMIKGETLAEEDMLMFMPLDKYQYAGPLAKMGLDAKALHKYTLMPLVPTVIAGTELEVLHNSMVEQNIDYAMFASGSKKFNVTKDGTLDEWEQPGDPWYKKGTEDLALGSYDFTKNVIYLEFLKEQVNITNEFKKKVISPSQQRFLLIEGAMRLGFPVDFMSGEENVEVRKNAWNAIKVLNEDGTINKKKTEEKKAGISPRYATVRRLELAVEVLIKTEIAELKREVGMIKNADGTTSYDFKKFMGIIQREFNRSDKFGKHSMRFAETFKNSIKDFSILPVGEDVEKMFVSYIIKKIISPKVNGETLNLVSTIGFQKIRVPDFTEADLEEFIKSKAITKKGEKYTYNGITYSSKDAVIKQLNLERGSGSTVGLTQEEVYRRGTNGLAGPWRDVIDGVPQKTHAGKAAIAFHPNFKKLLKSKHTDGEVIGTRDRLNDMLKSEAWMNTKNATGSNRDLVTIIGPRVPTNKYNTMTFMEVYHFYPFEFGEKIVTYGELSAIAGSDMDGDNLKLQFPNIMIVDGLVQLSKQMSVGKAKEIYKLLTKAQVDTLAVSELAGEETWKKGYFREKLKGDFDRLDKLLSSMFGSEYYIEELQVMTEGGLGTFDEFYFRLQKKSVENELLFAMKGLLELPENFADLITPNITTTLEDYADQLSEYTTDYDTKAGVHGTTKSTSPSKMLELPFHLYMQEVFKYFGKGIAISAVHNKFTPLASRVNMTLKRSYTVGRGDNAYQRPIRILLPHRTQKINNQDHITLSDIEDIDGLNIISDINSEELNGAVDGAKNPFLYFLLFSDITLPITHLLRSAGTPELTTYMFIANPLIKRYLRQFINDKSTISNLTRTGGPLKWQHSRGEARDQILREVFGIGVDDKSLYSTTKRFILDPLLNKLVNKTSIDSPMNYEMPASENVTGKKTSTIALVENGKRTATTRSSKLGNVGDYVTFNGRPGKYRITKVEQLTDINTNDPNWIKEWSKKEQWTEDHFRSILNKTSTVKVGSWQTTFEKLTEEEAKPLEFTQEEFLKRLKAGQQPDYVPNDMDKAALLHYFELEDLDSLKKLKIHSNYDTKNLKTLFNMTNRDFLLEMLERDGQIESTSLRKFLDDTVIGSFRQSDIIKEIVGKMFPLRNHKLISEFLINQISHGMSQAVEDTWDDQEVFIDQFHNQFMGMLFQNTLRGFNLDKLKEYKGYSVATGIPIEEVADLQGGVHIKDDVIYVDRKAIRNAITSVDGALAFAKTSAYQKYGAPLEAGTTISAQEFEHFVIERAYLRSNTPVESIIETKEFKRRYKENLSINKKAEDEEQSTFEKRMKVRSYEEYLRDKALDNIFLPWKLFRNKKSSMAQKLKNIQESATEEFKGKYPILRYLQSVGFDSEQGLKNIKLTDNRITATEINIYNENIVDLQNSDDPEISSFFQMLPYFAIMQSSFNTKNQFSLLKIIPWEGIYNVMGKGADQYRKLFDKAAIGDKQAKNKFDDLMIKFYDKFITSNASDPEHLYTRDKFIDYLFRIGKKEEVLINLNPQHEGKPEFNKLPGRSRTPTMTYAGIGSRETPVPITKEMVELAKELEGLGFTVNTGTAVRADEAFRKGATKKNVFGKEDATDQTKAIAREIHPNPTAVDNMDAKYGEGSTERAWQMHARNTNQVFGKNLDTPVDFVIAWTKDGGPTGGTGQAIRYATLKGIPVINMFNSNWRDQLKQVIADATLAKAPVSKTPISTPLGKKVAEGVYVNQEGLNKEEQIELFELIKPALQKQAARTNKGQFAPKMAGLGLNWDYVSHRRDQTRVDVKGALRPNNTYGWFKQSVNKLPLGEMTPRFRELMSKATGIDVTNYDGSIINIYKDDSFIGNHPDIDESTTAKNYPVVVVNIGGTGNIVMGTDKQAIPPINLRSGAGYSFGFKGENRTIPHSTYASATKGFLPALTTEVDGDTFAAGSYRISITMRRVMPLEKSMPTEPATVNIFQSNTATPVTQSSEFAEQSPGVFLYPVTKDWAKLVKTAKANSDKLFVFNMAIGKNAKRLNQGADFGLHDLVGKNAVGMPLRKTYGTTDAAHLTDDTLDDNKVAIDDAITNILAKKAQGMEVIFNPYGYGQAMIGAHPLSGRIIDPNKEALAPETFRYLSEQMKEKLGYMNKNYFTEKEKQAFKQRLQPVNDQELDTFITHCRNLASA